jgi:hypothetical protein
MGGIVAAFGLGRQRQDRAGEAGRRKYRRRKKACEPSTVAASSSVPYQPSITTSVVAIAIWAICVPTSGNPSANVAQI